MYLIRKPCQFYLQVTFKFHDREFFIEQQFSIGRSSVRISAARTVPDRGINCREFQEFCINVQLDKDKLTLQSVRASISHVSSKFEKGKTYTCHLRRSTARKAMNNIPTLDSITHLFDYLRTTDRLECPWVLSY